MNQDERNRKRREKYAASAEQRKRELEYSKRYYLSHKQNWKLYDVNRKRRIAERIKKNCGGMKV